MLCAWGSMSGMRVRGEHFCAQIHGCVHAARINGTKSARGRGRMQSGRSARGARRKVGGTAAAANASARKRGVAASPELSHLASPFQSFFLTSDMPKCRRNLGISPTPRKYHCVTFPLPFAACRCRLGVRRTDDTLALCECPSFDTRLQRDSHIPQRTHSTWAFSKIPLLDRRR